MLLKLNSEIYARIGNANGFFTIPVYKSVISGNPVTLPIQHLQTLQPVGIFHAEKTKALSKCYKIYLSNKEVGMDLFLKALDIEKLCEGELKECLKALKNNL